MKKILGYIKYTIDYSIETIASDRQKWRQKSSGN